MKPNDIFIAVSEVLFSDRKIENWEEYLWASHLVGPPGAHNKENIIQKTKTYIDKHQQGPDKIDGLKLPQYAAGEIYEIIEAVCGTKVEMDTNDMGDQRWVSLEHFKNGMKRAVEIADHVAGSGGLVMIATGHPGSLPPAYAYIRNCLIDRGARFYTPGLHTLVLDGQEMYISSVCGVFGYFVGDEMLHSHNGIAMTTVLAEGIRPDLVIADHGLAAAAIREEIPTIAIVDTNDIALLIATDLYPDRVFPIPIHDNAGFEASMAMAYYFEHLLSWGLLSWGRRN